MELDPFRKWMHFPKKHKHESLGMYSEDPLASPYCYVGAMICRLFGIHDSAKFSIEMVPLMEAIINSYIMDWVTILSNKISNQILDYRKNRFVSTRVIPLFYTSAYILDTICFNFEHPILVWKWSPKYLNPIHIYHKELWKAHYKNHLYRIYHGFILPVHYAIFNRPTPRLSDEASINLTSIGSWFG